MKNRVQDTGEDIAQVDLVVSFDAPCVPRLCRRGCNGGGALSRRCRGWADGHRSGIYAPPVGSATAGLFELLPQLHCILTATFFMRYIVLLGEGLEVCNYEEIHQLPGYFPEK